MADLPLPPPPYLTGNFPPTWLAWFRTLYSRVGQSVALSNTELEALHDSAVTALQKQVNDLTTTVTALQAQVNEGFNDLGQGPVL